MSVAIKVVAVDDKMENVILKLKGYIMYISAFPVLKIMVMSNYKDC